jgi:predicted ATPase
MIEHIRIRNFKSIGDVSVDLSPVTVLIGRSGVGKSNFLRAIRFLRNFLLRGDQAIQQEGGWKRIWPFGVPAPLSFTVRFLLPGYVEAFNYEIDWQFLQNGQHVMVAAERLSIGVDVVFDRDGTTWKKWPGEGAAPQLNPHSSSQVYLNSFPTLSEAVLAYTAWTTGVGWHDFPANVFAQVTPSDNNRRLHGLDDDAGNFLDVIREMTQDLRNQRSRRQILARVKQINPTVDSLELDSIIQPTRVVVAHKVGEQRIGLDLSQESDGFRRYYAHLLALYQTPPKQLLMFEEPENGVYPGALRNLAEEFIAAPDAGRGQILLATQSPDLLDGFKPEQLRVVDLDEKQLTRIAPLDAGQSDALHANLLEPGELLTVDMARAAGPSA